MTSTSSLPHIAKIVFVSVASLMMIYAVFMVGSRINEWFDNRQPNDYMDSIEADWTVAEIVPCKEAEEQQPYVTFDSFLLGHRCASSLISHLSVTAQYQ